MLEAAYPHPHRLLSQSIALRSRPAGLPKTSAQADEAVAMFQPLRRGEPLPVNGADSVAGHTAFGCRAQSRRPAGAPRSPT